MATYFHGACSEIQADNMHTLYLMNPNYSGYSTVSDATHHHHPPPLPPNMLLLNPGIPAHNPLSSAASNIPHGQLPGQHLVGIPLHGPNPDDQAGRPSLHHLYNMWSSVEASGGGSQQPNVVPPTGVVVESRGYHDMMRFRRQQSIGGHHHQQQGLSLSLSPHRNSLSAGQLQGPVSGGGEEMRMSVGCSPTSVSAASNGASGMQSVIFGSRYLKAVQQLLDEVVSVGKAALNEQSSSVAADGVKKGKGKAAAAPRDAGEGSSGGAESSEKRAAELTTAQRQELQMKKAKLLSMLDEVEQRYRRYHTQMQVVVTSFEQAAGLGSVRSYTSLALKTISKQFRCLKDAITAQIKSTCKSLGEGEDDGLLHGGGRGEGTSSSSRLRFLDQQLQQQRVLQHLGVVQQNAWRPQRGLPERAVSVLRAWLFEHFLHPYPKDSDKHMLAKRTGLTRSQVSNWFINARVRLWKPMVEEMYLEEIKGHEQKIGPEDKSTKNERGNNNDSGASSQTAPPPAKHSTTALGIMGIIDHRAVKSLLQPQDKSHNPIPPMNHGISTMPSATFHAQQGFSLVGSSDMQFMVSPAKKQRSANVTDMQNSPSSILSMETEIKPASDAGKDLVPRYGAADRHSLLAPGGPNHGFGAYQFGDIGRFDPELLGQTYHGNGVSLTLGLHHSENLSSISGTHQQNYPPNQNIQLGRRLEMAPPGDPADFCGITTGGQPSHSDSTGYEGIDIQNRKRFAAQLMPDFVT